MKKRNILYIAFFSCFFVFMKSASADTLSKTYVVCNDPNILKGIRILGYVIMALKIMVPIILIITSMYSMFKATLSSDDKASREAVNLFIKKGFTAAAIFFIPTILYACFSVVSGYDKTKNKYSDCGKCVTSIKACDTLIKKYTK